MPDLVRTRCTEAVTQAIMQVNWLARRQLHNALTARGLTIPQFVVLLHLHQQRGGCAVHEIAKATMQERATMTGILDRLEQAGLVHRQRSQTDRRRWIITLTDAGTHLLQATQRENHEHLKRALADFSLDDLAQFERLLGRLSNALQVPLPKEEDVA